MFHDCWKTTTKILLIRYYCVIIRKSNQGIKGVEGEERDRKSQREKKGERSEKPGERMKRGGKSRKKRETRNKREEETILSISRLPFQCWLWVLPWSDLSFYVIVLCSFLPVPVVLISFQAMWECSLCTLCNDEGKEKCEACGTRKPRRPRIVSPPSLSPSPPSKSSFSPSSSSFHSRSRSRHRTKTEDRGKKESDTPPQEQKSGISVRHRLEEWYSSVLSPKNETEKKKKTKSAKGNEGNSLARIPSKGRNQNSKFTPSPILFFFLSLLSLVVRVSPFSFLSSDTPSTILMTSLFFSHSFFLSPAVHPKKKSEIATSRVVKLRVFSFLSFPLMVWIRCVVLFLPGRRMYGELTKRNFSLSPSPHLTLVQKPAEPSNCLFSSFCIYETSVLLDGEVLKTGCQSFPTEKTSLMNYDGSLRESITEWHRNRR